MKVVNVYRFVKVVVENNRDITSITAREVNTFCNRVIGEALECELGGEAFEQCCSYYPDYIKKNQTEIVISQQQELLEALSKRLRFVEDRALDELILQNWQVE